MRLLMIQRMVNMKVIVGQTYQKDTRLMDKIVTLMNIISMNMIMENHHVMICPKANRAKD